MKFSCLWFTFTLLYLAGALNCFGQGADFQIKTFTTEHGLSHNVIHSITQDRTGFLWLATWDGLSRFDGNEFRNYRHNPDDSGSLPFFAPARVIADSLNNLWVLTSGWPVYKYNRARDNFRPAFDGLYKDAPAGDLVTVSGGNIWVSLETELLLHNPVLEEYTPFRIILNDPAVPVVAATYPALSVDNLGQLWLLFRNNEEWRIYKGIISGKEIICRFAGSLLLHGYISTPIRNSLINQQIHVSEGGNIWLSCKYGIFKCDTVSGKFIHKTCLDRDAYPKQKFFCWTDDLAGINVLNTENSTVSFPGIEEGEYVECIFRDREGNIWSGNINKSRVDLGLNRYNMVPDCFTHYLTGLNEDSTANIVFPVVKDRNGDVWIGTRYHECLHIIRADGSDTRFCLPPDKPGGSIPVTRCMAEDQHGIWFGTIDGKLYYQSFERRGTIRVYPAPGSCENGISGIHNIIYDSGSLVINGSEGIYRFNILTGTPELHYRHDPPGTGFSLVKDDKGGFWLGTWGSRVIHLNSILEKTGEFTLGNGGNIVEHICTGDSSDIWVALMGGGLGHLFPETGEAEIFTASDGLSNNVTYSILRDSRGFLWISTNQGISVFNPASRFFRNYGKAEGLLIEEFDSDSYFKAASGEMLFGGVGGVVMFHPDTISGYQRNKDFMTLTITDLTVSGLEYQSEKAPYESDTVRLSKGDNNFCATFTLFDFKNPEKIRYRYRLLGEDRNWIMADHRTRSVSYANLTHRDYNLEIEATDELGEWVFRKSLLISIPHRFSEYLVVRISALLFFIIPLILAGVFYVKQQKMKEKNIRDRLRLESLRSHMNPHFVFNSLSSINYFIAKEDKFKANEYIADFSRLIRSFIDNAGHDFIPLEGELQSLRDYLKLEHLRFGDRFTYTMSVEKTVMPGEIKVFPGMIQPFVENAIWHGVRNLHDRLGHISVEIFQTGTNRLRCIVEDDGIGCRNAAMFKSRFNDHQSRGIELVRERLRIFNAMSRTDCRIVIEDVFPEKEETGTRVIIDLPAMCPAS